MTTHLLLFYDNVLLIRVSGSVSSVVYYEKSGGKMVHVLSLSSRQVAFFFRYLLARWCESKAGKVFSYSFIPKV